jgi:hypothetical protein
MNLENNWKWLRISLLLLSGQFSVFATPNIKLSLPFPKSSHWNNKWSTVCSAFPHGHVGDSIILNLYKYDFKFPCPVAILNHYKGAPCERNGIRLVGWPMRFKFNRKHRNVMLHGTLPILLILIFNYTMKVI